MKTTKILGVNIIVSDMEKILKHFIDKIAELKGKYICVSNVHTTVMSYEDEEYCNIQNSSYMALPDGRPLSIISKSRGYKEAKRIDGPELMIRTLELSERYGFTHYFYGSTEDTLNELMKNIKNKYPKTKIVGYYSPPFREITEVEDNEIVKEINSLSPDFVWVGLGAPKQEVWMYNHQNRVKALMIGVGAAFDYHAGKIKRAPKWVQYISMEWFYRLVQDPKRLWKRYFKTNFKFMYYIIFNKKNEKTKIVESGEDISL